MIVYQTISTFRKRLEDLLSVKRGVYSGVKNEIQKEFSDSSIDKIRQNRDMILIDDEAILIKLRLPDKKQRLSKSDGYRLIYLVSKVVEKVVFLDIYPKRGPSQQLDIDDKEIERLMSEFTEEAQAGVLEGYEF